MPYIKNISTFAERIIYGVMDYYVSRYTHLFRHQGQHYLFAIRTTDLACITPALYRLLQAAKETISPIDAPQEFLTLTFQ